MAGSHGRLSVPANEKFTFSVFIYDNIMKRTPVASIVDLRAIQTG